MENQRVNCCTNWKKSRNYPLNHVHVINHLYWDNMRLQNCMMTSSNGNIFRVSGPFAGNSPVAGEFPAQRPVTRSFDAVFDLWLNKRLSKQSLGWWFETPRCSYDVIVMRCIAWIQHEHHDNQYKTNNNKTCISMALCKTVVTPVR